MHECQPTPPLTCFCGAEGQPRVVHDHGVDDGAGHAVPRQQPHAGADALLHLLLGGAKVQPAGEAGGKEARRGGPSAAEGAKSAERQAVISGVVFNKPSPSLAPAPSGGYGRPPGSTM